jgi:2,4-dienoyl-CoA reductase-like NADH-dependent reductase (Old Yellow Enzyme family)
MTGTPIVSPSGLPWDNPNEVFAYPPPHTTKQVRYVDNPPIELTVEHIKKTIQDYVRTAKWAIECGFDGVEVHGGNGYLPEQFLASNVNKRTDAYGGSPEKRCTFTLELMEELSKAIGEENLAIRLSPFGLFNQIRCEQRMETWTTLCRKLKEAHPSLLRELHRTRPCPLPPPSPTLTCHSATNKSTANPKNKSSSTPGASARLTWPLFARSSVARLSSLPAASMRQTRGAYSNQEDTMRCCMAGTLSATRICPRG